MDYEGIYIPAADDHRSVKAKLLLEQDFKNLTPDEQIEQLESLIGMIHTMKDNINKIENGLLENKE